MGDEIYRQRERERDMKDERDILWKTDMMIEIEIDREPCAMRDRDIEKVPT